VLDNSRTCELLGLVMSVLLTLFTTMPPRLWATKMIGRFCACALISRIDNDRRRQ